MMPNRRQPSALSLAHRWILSVLVLCGCTASAVRLPNPDADQLAEVEAKVRTVGDFTVPVGLNSVKVEAVALVTGLDGTGSDPPPSSRRAVLIGEMQARDVPNPNAILASSDTSLVIVVGFLPPGIRKGERFDVQVRVPSKSETVSLRGGWLMALKRESS